MRIAIVGVGGVGGYIGAKFCALKEQDPRYNITFIARGSHAEAIRHHGIEVIEDDHTFTATPSEVVTAKEVEGSFDLMLICVKSYDLHDTITTLQPTIRPDTVIIPFANGVNNAQVIRNLVTAKVLDGCAYILSHIESPGVIRKQGKVFAAIFGNPKYYGEVLHVSYLFKDVGLRYKTPENIEEALWKKYLFIGAFATLTTYYDMSIKKVYTTHKDIAQATLEEIISLAKAKGIDITHELTKTLEGASKLPNDASTSMHLDAQQGHRTELEALTGYVVHEAKHFNLSVPNITNMYHILKERLHGQ